MLPRNCILALMLCLAFEGMAASTNTIFVTSTNDSGPGSLREAIQQQNSLGGGTISLTLTGTITLASSFPPLTNIDLRGPGTNFIRISGNNTCRPFEIAEGSTSLLAGLRICCGVGSNGGGGILNSGSLSIQNCALDNNSASGFPGSAFSAGGGAVLNNARHANLSVRNSYFAFNRASGRSPPYGRGLPGGTALGGAVCSTGSGSVTIADCIFLRNSTSGARGPDGGTGFPGGGGGSALGGAIYVADHFGDGGSGQLNVTNSSFVSNNAIGAASGVPSSAAGGDAQGAAVYLWRAQGNFVNCSFLSNGLAGGTGGSERYGGLGGQAAGAGIYALHNQSVLVMNCSFLGGNGQGGRGGNGYSFGVAGGGGSATGIGLFLQGTNALIAGSTFAGNRGRGGEGGTHSPNGPANGGGVLGAGLALRFSTNVIVINTTISGNVADTNRFTGCNGTGLYAQSSIVFVTNITVVSNVMLTAGSGGGAYGIRARNSLFSGNRVPLDSSGPDAYRIVSDGFNLFSSTNGVTNLLASDLRNVDAQVGPLQDNGGPTWTHALLAGSPALDRGNAGTVSVDQRGLPRGLDYPEIPNTSNADDIGAFESDPVQILRFTGIEISGDDIYVRFPTRSDETYRLESKAGLASAWESSFSITGTGGILRLHAGSRLEGQRFFRIASP